MESRIFAKFNTNNREQLRDLLAAWDAKHEDQWFAISRTFPLGYSLEQVWVGGHTNTVHVGSVKEIIAYLKGAVMAGCHLIHV